MKRLLALFRKRRLDRELENEIRGHLELAERDAIASGMSVEEARLAARRDFGGVEQMKEEHRDHRGFRWLETMAKDFRYGLASLRRDPVFALVAVGVLALGIGANTAMFSVVDAVLLKPIPFPEPDRMVWVWEAPTATSRNQTTTANFLEWKRRTTVFEALSAASEVSAAVMIGGEPARLKGVRVSADYFKVFSVHAQIGRTFESQDDQTGAARVIVLSHAVWQTRFGGDPDILNRDIRLDGEAHRIIGVLPAGTFDRDKAGFWKPILLDEQQMGGNHWLDVVGRVRKGVSLEQAQQEMLAVRASLADITPPFKKDWSIAVDPFAQLLVRDSLRQSIYIAFAAVVMVLLIACANLANLLLAKGISRRKEMALRVALGASRGRLIGQLLTESLVLCLLGGTAGVVLAAALIRAAVPMLPEAMPFTAEVTLDMRVLGFAAAVALGISLVVGVLPALQTSNQVTRGTTRSREALRRLIVAGEVAISLVLICGALLLFRSLMNLQRQDAGVRIDNVITMSANLPLAAYPTPESATGFFNDVVERLRTVPGVERAAVSQDVPLEGVRGGENIRVAGSNERILVGFKRVDPGYFDTFEIPVVSGRGITERDRAGALRVVVINRELARQLSDRFGMADPVGQTVRLAAPYYAKQDASIEDVQIVGVIRSERVARDLREPLRAVVYVPLAQVPRREIKLIVRTQGEPASTVPGIREVVRQLDPNLPLEDVRTMVQVKQRGLSGATEPAWVIGAFAGVAALLAALGLYGVLSHAVTQQRKEIGIRIALGARSHDVLSHVMRSALSTVIVGLTVGLFAAFALTRLMKSLLFEVSALDPAAIVIACIAMTLICLLAGYLPARRAARVDPMMALREEG